MYRERLSARADPAARREPARASWIFRAAPRRLIRSIIPALGICFRWCCSPTPRTAVNHVVVHDDIEPVPGIQILEHVCQRGFGLGDFFPDMLPSGRGR